MMDLSKMLFLPLNASEHGVEVDKLIIYVHVLMFVLLVGWGTYFIYCLFRFSKKNNPKADYKGLRSHFSVYVEIGVAVAEVFLLVWISMPLWATQVNAFPKGDDVLEVKVMAEQYAWNFHYSGIDGVFGETSIDLVNKASNPLGLDPDDEFGKDDFTTLNQMHIPVDKPVVVHLTSRDVIHSFGIPYMRVKQDAIPGMSIPTWFTPTKVSPKGKPFEVVCSQLCGIGHYKMKGFITVEKQEAFDNWFNEKSAESQEMEEVDSFWN